jgi:rhodanese-related sulfurtransferase
MQQRVYLLAITLLLSIGPIGCTQVDGVAATPVAQSQLAAVSTPDDPAAYRAKLDEARNALEKGDFETAKDLAREAARFNPTDNTAWSVFEEAVLKQTADNYLRTLPDSRYRLNTEHFLADQVNGKQFFILDVREPDEYEGGHIDGALNIPLRQLTQNLDKLPDGKSHPILVYCHTQKRATHALVVLRELGYTNVFNLKGGIEAYQEWTANNPRPTPGPTATPAPEEPSC